MDLSTNSSSKIEETTKRLLKKAFEISSLNVYSKFSLSIPVFKNLLLIYESVYEKFKNEENYEAAFYILRKKEIFIDICRLKDRYSYDDHVFYYAKANGKLASDINERLSGLWFELQEKYSQECEVNPDEAERNFNERWLVTKSIQSLCENTFNEMLNEHEVKIDDLDEATYENLSFRGTFPILPPEAINDIEYGGPSSNDEMMTSDDDEMRYHFNNESESETTHNERSNEGSENKSIDNDEAEKSPHIENFEENPKSDERVPQDENEDIDIEVPIEVLSPQNPEYQNLFEYGKDAKGGKNVRMDVETSESDDDLSNRGKNKTSIGKKMFENLPSVQQPLSPYSSADESMDEGCNEPQPSTSSGFTQCSSNPNYKCEVVKTQRGNDKIMFRGFMYVKFRTNSWRCDQRGKKKANCNVMVKTKSENGCYYMVDGFDKKHTHPPSLARFEKQRADGKIKSYAKSCGKPTGKLMRVFSNEYSEEVLKKSGSETAVKRKIQRAREKKRKEEENNQQN